MIYNTYFNMSELYINVIWMVLSFYFY